MSLRTTNKLLGLFSAVCDVVLGLSDKRENDQSYSFVLPKAEQPPVLPLLALPKRQAQESR